MQPSDIQMNHQVKMKMLVRLKYVCDGRTRKLIGEAFLPFSQEKDQDLQVHDVTSEGDLV